MPKPSLLQRGAKLKRNNDFSTALNVGLLHDIIERIVWFVLGAFHEDLYFYLCRVTKSAWDFP